MNISTAALLAQYDRAAAEWPFIRDIEASSGILPMLLFAVGSRETNLTNEAGDYDPQGRPHGFGVWQRDIQWGVGPWYLADVHRQCVDAASLLRADFIRCGSWQGAADAYNSGQCGDAGTTGHDYGADVMARQQVLVANRGSRYRVLMLLPAPNFMHGPDVLCLQQALNAKRLCSPPVGADGVYGPRTVEAVRQAQGVLHISQDGITGVQTWTAIENYRG